MKIETDKVTEKSAITSVNPNLKKNYKKIYKIFIITQILIIPFLGLMIATTVGDFLQTTANIVLFAFLLLVSIFIVIGVVFARKLVPTYYLVNLIDTVEKNNDYTFITALSNPKFSAQGNLEIVKKLIDTENLPSYEMVANVLVAKKSLRMSDAKAKKLYNDSLSVTTQETLAVVRTTVIKEEKPIITTCPNCGANVDSEVDVYCPYCGKRLA